MTARRALVIGGSVGGLFAANLLRQSGWEVSVFERSTEDLAGRGSGIGTRDTLFQVMRRIGIEPDPTAGVPVRSRVALERDGTISHEFVVAAVNSAWDRIYRPLREIFPGEDFHAGRMLTGLAQEPGGITAIFADGTRIAGDLLVGADGVHSTVRSIILPGVGPRYGGYVAWRGILEESDLPAEMHHTLFEHFSFGLPEGELIIALPMPGRDADTRAGHRRYHWVWFRPLDLERGVRDLCTDASGKCHGVSIPPPLIRPEVLEEVKAHAAAVLAPQLAFAVAHTRRLLLQPIFDLESPRIAVGRAVLLGDAAFAARPHVGAGVTKAALDAAGLADALADGEIEAGLARYDRERCAAGSTLVARGRQLGAHLEAQHKPREERTAAELAHDPPAVLRDYGAAVISAADMGERG